MSHGWLDLSGADPRSSQPLRDDLVVTLGQQTGIAVAGVAHHPLIGVGQAATAVPDEGSELPRRRRGRIAAPSGPFAADSRSWLATADSAGSACRASTRAASPAARNARVVPAGFAFAFTDRFQRDRAVLAFHVGEHVRGEEKRFACVFTRLLVDDHAFLLARRHLHAVRADLKANPAVADNDARRPGTAGPTSVAAQSRFNLLDGKVQKGGRESASTSRAARVGKPEPPRHRSRAKQA